MDAYFRLSEVHPTAGKAVGSQVQCHQVKKNVSKQFISYYAYNTMKKIFFSYGIGNHFINII